MSRLRRSDGCREAKQTTNGLTLRTAAGRKAETANKLDSRQLELSMDSLIENVLGARRYMNQSQNSPDSPGASGKGKDNGVARDFGVIAYQLFEVSISIFIPGTIVVCLYGSQLVELLGLKNHELLEEAMKSSGFVSVFMFLIPAWIFGWFLAVVGFQFAQFVLRRGIFVFLAWAVIYIVACAISYFPEYFISLVHLIVVLTMILIALSFIIWAIIIRAISRQKRLQFIRVVIQRKHSQIICHIIQRKTMEQLFPSSSPFTTEAEDDRQRVSVLWRTRFAAKQMFRSMVVISLFIPLLRPYNWPCGGRGFWLDIGLFGFSLLVWSLMHLDHLEAAKAKQEKGSTPKA